MNILVQLQDIYFMIIKYEKCNQLYAVQIILDSKKFTKILLRMNHVLISVLNLWV
jgi:hypothetical protein